MRFFHRFWGKMAWNHFSLRRRSIFDTESNDDEENDDLLNDDDRPFSEDETSSSLLLLEMMDDKNTAYYELSPPTLGVTNTNTGITSSSSSGRRHSRHNATTSRTLLLNRCRDSTTGSTTQPTTRLTTLPASSTAPVGRSHNNTFSPTNVNSRRRNKSISARGVGEHNRQHTTHEPIPASRLYATILDLPHLVQTLQSSINVTCDEASHTLRRLFALSEYTSATMKGGGTTRIFGSSPLATANEYELLEETRNQMVTDPSCLVPCLFHFLIRCYVEDNSSTSILSCRTVSENLNHIRHSREERTKSKRTISHPVTMYLALLVLNNLCIPNDNKRYIAFQCHGIDIICHLLCYDPSCRMLAIVLVNLTFGTNVQFQHDLLFQNESNADTELLASLAYVLRVASLTRDEYNVRQRLFVKEAHEIFCWDSRSNTLAVDSTTREQQLNALLVFDQYDIYTKSWPLQSEQIYPDTARWCICALHHLTRPLQYSSQTSDPYDTAAVSPHPYKASPAMALTRTNIVQHLLCCIRIGTSHNAVHTDERSKSSKHVLASALICQTSNDHQMLSDDLVVAFNDPSTWVKETSQDAALFVIMNISIDPYGRKYLLGHDIDAVYLLASVADSYHTSSALVAKQTAAFTNDESQDAIKVQQFQCVKARMTLSYLVGSQGHYGQEQARVGSWVKDYIHNKHVLAMKDEFEVQILLDILAHTMNRRTKDGPGGFSGTTFRIKYIVWAIRGLLTQPENQEMFAGNGMEVLNAFLIKILALRAIRNATYIDSETAEHACFSLYLLSHYGFHICFLPSSLGMGYNVRYIVTKTLIAIQSMKDTTLATRHAARQILWRLRYLLCIDTVASMSAMTNENYIFEKSLVNSVCNLLIADKVPSGAQPRLDIFNHPIISRRRCRNREMNHDGDDDHGSTTVSTYYNSAIQAAYDFSFQSTAAQRLNETSIDDIAIANNIANCADGKSSDELFGCSWTWDDDDADGVDDLMESGNQTKHTLQGEIGGRRQRSNRARVQDNKNDRKAFSIWSSLLFSPRNFCGGDGVPCSTSNDGESYNEKVHA